MSTYNIVGIEFEDGINVLIIPYFGDALAIVFYLVLYL